MAGRPRGTERVTKVKLQRKTRKVINNPLGIPLANYCLGYNDANDGLGFDEYNISSIVLPSFIDDTITGVMRLQWGRKGLKFSVLLSVLMQATITVESVQVRYKYSYEAAKLYTRAARMVIQHLQRFNPSELALFIEQNQTVATECYCGYCERCCL